MMMTPEQTWPVINTLRFTIGLVFLGIFARPVPDRNFRIRFWIAIPTLAVIALIGLRPAAVGLSARNSWVTYGSIFQAVVNFVVIGVLLLRYRLYMPREDVAQ